MIRTSNQIKLLMSALVIFAMLLTGGVAQASTDTASGDMTGVEEAFHEAINASRAAEGLDPLVVNAELSDIARAWSLEMDATGQLGHNPHYSAQYSGDWSRMGENVGYTTWRGADPLAIVPGLHQAFMDSPAHRANILGGYNQVGIGAVMTGDTLWVTVNFLQGTVVEPAPEVEVIVVPEQSPPARSHFVRR